MAPGIYADRISIKEFIFVDPSTGGIFIKKGRLVQLHSEMLVEQLSAHALSAWDTENHFRAMAATGDVRQALGILDRLDAADAREQGT